MSLAGALALAVVATAPTSAAVDENALFLKWQTAVVTHSPGHLDAAIESVWAMGADDRKAIDDKVDNYLDVIADPLKYQDPSGMPKGSNKIGYELVIAARQTAHLFTPRTFLEHAAMLHADAVMFDRRPAAPAAPPPAAQPQRNPTDSRGIIIGAPQQQAVAQTGYVTIEDGETTGRVAENWNWAFGRHMLDRAKPPADDPFVSAWYHGTSAYLMRHGEFGEVVRHLDHAAEMLPSDARILFDRGTVAEILAMNIFQQVAADPKAPPATIKYGGNGGFATSSSAQRGMQLPDAADSNARARGYYQKAIAANPGLVEAHVRLARELELDNNFTGALDEVRQALALDPPTEVAFYAHLFGVRAANALGRDDDAATHAAAALALYPSASSALLASSHTALHRSDPGTAVEELNRLGEEPMDLAASGRADPWLQYMFGAGRQAESALTELWNLTPAKLAR